MGTSIKDNLIPVQKWLLKSDVNWNLTWKVPLLPECDDDDDLSVDDLCELKENVAKWISTAVSIVEGVKRFGGTCKVSIKDNSINIELCATTWKLTKIASAMEPPVRTRFLNHIEFPHPDDPNERLELILEGDHLYAVPLGFCFVLDAAGWEEVGPEDLGL